VSWSASSTSSAGDKEAFDAVLDVGAKDFRDPKVFWHEATRRWVMVVALSDQNKVRFYASPDLQRWGALSDFGPQGAIDGVWECPDLFELPVEGQTGRTRWVLDVDVGAGAPAGGTGGQYFVGEFDGTRFRSDLPADAPVRWVDHGRDFYASTSFSDLPESDSRRIWMGWLSNWEYAKVEPTPPWRGMQSVPREVRLVPAGDELVLAQQPVREVETLRGTPVVVEPGRFAGRHSGPPALDRGLLRLRVLVDRSSVEAFGGDGRIVISDRIFPRPTSRGVALFAEGGTAEIVSLRAWPLGAAVRP